MKILSSTHNGIVKVTANPGFSIKRSVEKIEKELIKNGYLVDGIEFARSGTCYIEVGKLSDDYFYYTIRVSNHTKRGYKLKYTEVTEEYMGWISCVNVLNTEMLHKYIQYLSKNKV